MCKESKLINDIEGFLNNQILICFLDKLYEYGEFLKTVLKEQGPETITVINNEELQDEYDEYQKLFPRYIEIIDNMLFVKNLNRKRMHSFYNLDPTGKTRKVIKPEYEHIFSFIKVTSFFLALTRKHINEPFDLTLEERIIQLQKLSVNHRQSIIADMQGMENISKLITRQIPKKIA